jgi:hypothetical protein
MGATLQVHGGLVNIVPSHLPATIGAK